VTTDLKPGDQVVVIAPRVSRRGPWPVQRIEEDTELIWVQQRTKGGHAHPVIYSAQDLVKVEPGADIRQILRAVVPANQFCEICQDQPAPERHFVTVPLPKGFTRVCGEDFAGIKAEIRKRVAHIVSEVFAEARGKAQK